MPSSPSSPPICNQTVSFLGFGVATSLLRTVVHFFPSAGGVTAPYPTNCTITVFGQGLPRRHVVLEGARMSHPDGVRLDEVFPELKREMTGFFGFSLELSTTQPRVDLTESDCVIELAGRGHSLRFRAARSVSQESWDTRSLMLLHDERLRCSVVGVNASSGMAKAMMTDPDGEAGAPSVETEHLLPESVQETPYPEGIFQRHSSDGGIIGATRARRVVMQDAPPKDVAYYVLYRDAATRQPVSIGAV